MKPFEFEALGNSVRMPVRKLEIFPKDYANGICRHLYRWVKRQQWRVLPSHVFCGKWAIGEYQTKITKKEHEDTPDELMDIGALVYEEWRIVQYYIQEKNVRFITFADVVEELNSMISADWMDAYHENKRLVIVNEVLPLISADVTLEELM